MNSICESLFVIRIPGQIKIASMVIILSFAIILLTCFTCSGSKESELIYKDPASFVKSQPEKEKDTRLSSTLSDIVREPSDGVPIRGIVSEDESNQTILVDIYVNTSQMNESELLPYLKEIIVRHRDAIEAQAYINTIHKLKNLSFVSYIDIPVLIESYKGLNNPCPLLESLNIKCPSSGGNGINMVVADMQFYSNDLTKTAIPDDTIFEGRHSYNADQIHGTACSEVIAQIVPEIKLYQIFAGNTPLQFLDAINNIEKLGEKIGVISCSCGFPIGPGLFNVHDDLYYAIENLTLNGTIWVNSAGNDAESHWSGSFNDPDENGFNNFSGSDESINITLNRGDDLKVILTWNDWPDPNYGNSTQDYALWVLGPTESDLKVADDPQTGRRNDFPQEICYMPIGHNGIYQILIEKKNANARNAQFHLFVESDTRNIRLDEYAVADGSLNSVACFDNVITVGAINSTSNEIMPYSSRGPTSDGRVKPDLVGPTNITTISTYPWPFTGTSAAAPAVAGCIALVLNHNGDLQEIYKHVIDLGPIGPDNIYGSGLVNMEFLT
jgi:hypothetical protein